MDVTRSRDWWRGVTIPSRCGQRRSNPSHMPHPGPRPTRSTGIPRTLSPLSRPAPTLAPLAPLAQQQSAETKVSVIFRLASPEYKAIRHGRASKINMDSWNHVFMYGLNSLVMVSEDIICNWLPRGNTSIRKGFLYKETAACSRSCFIYMKLKSLKTCRGCTWGRGGECICTWYLLMLLQIND